MPSNPGKRGGKGPKKRKLLPQVTNQIKRTYEQVTNTKSFFYKKTDVKN